MFVSIGQFLQVPNEVLQRLSGKEFKTVLQGLSQGKTLQELAGQVQDAHHFSLKSQVSSQQVQKSLQSRLKRAYLQIVFRIKQFQSRYRAAKAEVAEVQAELAARRARKTYNASSPTARPRTQSVKEDLSPEEMAERQLDKTNLQAAKMMQHPHNPVAQHADDWHSQHASLWDSQH
jgi:hypothetical protein